MLTLRWVFRPLVLGLGLATIACVPVTVNINFPQEKLEGAAGRIEDMVRSPENPPPPAAPRKGPQGSRQPWLWAALGPREALAQGRQVDVVPDVRVRTPELLKAIESRRARNPQIEQWKARGCVGENNRGLVEARPGSGCAGEVAPLVAAENADRQYIYQTLMQQNNIPASDAPRVGAAFAKANHDRARPGEWIQQESGAWVRR